MPAPAGLDPARIEPATTAALARAVPAGSPLLVAVSGGSDSVALLALLARVGGRRLHVVHVHHGLRATADRDADFVAGLARDLGLSSRVVAAPALEPGEAASETSSRRRRYAALRAVASDSGIRSVALAHHLDDQAETVALRLLRGPATDRSLCGIPFLRREAGLLLVRPVLAACDRAGLRALRLARGLPCVEDETNADRRIPRNRVRAWLASEGAGRRGELLALASRARARLQWRRARAVAALEAGLAPEGLGARLAVDAWTPPAGERAPLEYRAELLRLLALALARPRRLDPRAGQLGDLVRQVATGSGRFRLPATPRPLEGIVSPAGLHFPGEAPAAADPAVACCAALLAEPVPA